MAKNDGNGSIVLKLLIVVLAVVLIAVIVIPAQLWEQEAREMENGRANMSSIYEAERFYHRLNNSFTSDPAELLRVVREDSSLQRLQGLVNHTNELTSLMDAYINIPFIKDLAVFNDNIGRILEDLESNKRNFRNYEDIKNEAEDLRMHISAFNSSDQFPNYKITSAFVDSLVKLRRDLSDFSLLSGAAKTKTFTDTLLMAFPKVNVERLLEAWIPLSDRVKALVKNILHSDLVNVTSVGDRVRDFIKAADKSLNMMNTADISSDMAKAQEITKKVDEKYQEFLGDFLITSKRALYRLADADSMVLHLTENKFFCPVTGSQIKIIISDDSSSVKIESPILLDELKEKLMPVVDEIKNLTSMTAFKEYANALDSLNAKGYAIRKRLRKNTDIFIAYKQMEEVINRFNDIIVMTAYSDLETMIQRVPQSESFSELKEMTEKSLAGIQVFNQAYSENTFGNLDSLHKDLGNAIFEYDSLLSKVRRLPKDIVNFEEDKAQLDQLLGNIKKAADGNLGNLEEQIGKIFLFTSEGSTETKYGVFKKKIINFGYVTRGSKSWEEK